MYSSNSKEEKLFAKTVPVSITDGYSSSYRSLFLSIEWQQTSALILKKELFITLTDINDPFFLYNLQLSDDDFQRLKSGQNLLMDFSAFPEKIIHFLELCLSEAKQPQPNYLLHLDVGEKVGNIASTAQLDIEQSSVFRQVSLLSLKFLAATESSVKHHVTVGFNKLKEENQRLQNQLCHLERNFKERVSELESELERKSQDLESVKRDLNSEINQRENKHTQMLLEEREKLLNKQREGENRLESERIDREAKLKRDINHLEARVSCLEKLNKELENKKIELERRLDEQRSHNLSVENDLRTKTEALRKAEKRNSELCSEFKEASSRINHLMGNIKDINDSLERKETQIASMQRELEDSKKEKKKIANGLSATEEQLNKEKIKRKEAENDYLKANQIIAKYQATVFEENAENQALIYQVGKLEETTKKQEQSIQCLENDLDKEKKANRLLSREIPRISEYQEKIVKLEEENRQNIFVIGELNKLLNNNGIVAEYIPPPNLAEKFPFYEAINVKATGDTNLHKTEHSAQLSGAVQSNLMSSRSCIQNELNPEIRQMKANRPENFSNLPVNAANGLQPEIRKMKTMRTSSDSPMLASNVKVSTIIASDKNANQSNLEIISNGLSSEFKDLNVSKHSTARKQTSSVKSRLPRKS